MPISPNAPDYVGQVRGIIGDLRDNFLKKDQLYLQEKDQQDRIELARAQLGLQQQNSNQAAQIAQQNAELGQQKLAADLQSSNAQIANQRNSINAKAYEDRRQALRDDTKDALEKDKFNLELVREGRTLQKEQLLREQDVASGQLMTEGAVALNSNDPTKLIEWANKTYGSILSQQQRIAVLTDAYKLVDTKKLLEAQNKNIATTPRGKEIIQGITLLNVSEFDSPDQFAAVMNTATKEFNALGNTDQGLNDLFTTTLAGAAKRQQESRQKDYAQSWESYVKNANRRQLGVRFGDTVGQADWDNLQREYPDKESRGASSDYAEKVDKLMFAHNVGQSKKELARLAAQNQLTADNLTIQNPDTATVYVDPATGIKYRTFTFPTPDNAATIGNDANINPDTGLINKAALKRNEAWVAEITSPSFIYGQVPYGRGLLNDDKTQPVTRTAEQAKEIKGLPFRPTTQLGAGKEQAPASSQASTSSDRGLTEKRSPASATSPTEAPKADTTDYLKNATLLDEVDRQIKAGNITYMKDGKPTGINLNTLKNKIQSRMGQTINRTFNPSPAGVVNQFLTTPPATEEQVTE